LHTWIKTQTMIRCQFHQSSTSSFCTRRSRKHKKVVSIFLRFWDLRMQNLYVECWWNWPQVSISSKFYRKFLLLPDSKSAKNTVKLSVLLFFGICVSRSFESDFEKIDARLSKDYCLYFQHSRPFRHCHTLFRLTANTKKKSPGNPFGSC
jgi:hypothetical protein